MSSLFTVNNVKVEKGEDWGYHTAVLHLAPSNLSGFNVCPRATKGCIASCLNTAGRGGIFKVGETTNVIQEARKRRTRFLFSDPRQFAATLLRDTLRHLKRCKRIGLKPAFRFNGTSDIDLCRFQNGGVFMPAVGAALDAGAAVYDYSKRPDLFESYEAANLPIHLTFSRAETGANQRDAKALLKSGRNVAVVFGVKKSQPLPETFEGREVINGDKHDLRFLDPAGVVVGLRAKGKARRDTTGFVVAA